jgi:hypothetical protein
MYRRTVNLEEQGNGRRWSFVTAEDDFGPRTVLVDSLRPFKQEDPVVFSLEGIPAGYDPSLPPGRLNDRWIPLTSEWSGFLEGDLEMLASPAGLRAFGELLGLGPGSTPAGDDFLAGYITGSLWLGASLFPVLDPGRTTWLSGSILKDVEDGFTWKRSRDMLEALATDDAKRVTAAVAHILDWGHSSGRAWLAGFSAAVSDTIERTA